MEILKKKKKIKNNKLIYKNLKLNLNFLNKIEPCYNKGNQVIMDYNYKNNLKSNLSLYNLKKPTILIYRGHYSTDFTFELIESVYKLYVLYFFLNIKKKIRKIKGILLTDFFERKRKNPIIKIGVNGLVIKLNKYKFFRNRKVYNSKLKKILKIYTARHLNYYIHNLKIKKKTIKLKLSRKPIIKWIFKNIPKKTSATVRSIFLS